LQKQSATAMSFYVRERAMAKRPKAVCQKVSKKYLSLYIAEFQFRYNNRMNPDIFGAVVGGC
jgi:hypothetical protein